MEIITYPSGKVFPKIMPMGKANKREGRPKKKVNKLKESSKGGEVEI